MGIFGKLTRLFVMAWIISLIGTSLIMKSGCSNAYAGGSDSLLPGATVIHLKNGGAITCQEAWIKDQLLFLQKPYGRLALHLSAVDLERTNHSTEISYDEAKRMMLEKEKAKAESILAITPPH